MNSGLFSLPPGHLSTYSLIAHPLSCAYSLNSRNCISGSCCLSTVDTRAYSPTLMFLFPPFLNYVRFSKCCPRRRQ
ncbi:hypothetical protein MBAV_004864 [Candidatus Magnetobacterium bavaricum]|uniref:Uncharacterized protein n=1 Tax=Candidatus Magnetobacterium bavaricum TaxID=29290 RepID=A0A0F3GLZ6_9BACT|nr:hypothetical protein MBAV_004864 [Candidatus Magnetobacterium bavaricum]